MVPSEKESRIYNNIAVLNGEPKVNRRIFSLFLVEVYMYGCMKMESFTWKAFVNFTNIKIYTLCTIRTEQSKDTFVK